MPRYFPENIYSAAAPDGILREVVEGLKNNLHFAFELSGGETALADSLARRLEREPILVFRPCLRMATNAEHLVKNLSRLFISAFAGDRKKMESVLKKLIPTATAKIVMADTPYIDIQYGTDMNRLFANLLDVPEMMGTEDNKRAVVLWEGFDNLEGTMGSDALRQFTGKARGHAITSHVLIGRSVAKAAGEMGGPMLNQVRVIREEELLTPEAVKTYLASGWAQAGLTPPDGLTGKIYDAADGRAETAVILANAALRRGGKDGAALTAAMEEVIQNTATAYRAIWDLLNPRQKSVLYGLCAEDVKNIYAESFIKQYGFNTATNLQAALRALDHKNILHKRGKRWAFTDPLFKLWIGREAGLGGTERP
ncbi:MAG: hypothetical protein HZA04_01470 [Nitrospinae bacterium]|nr:hypothetical protein [Nitrospinota bacterium]